MNEFQKAPKPKNEGDRLKALHSYEIIESGRDKNFDELAELASYICDTPIALITFMEEERQWDKSFVGMNEGQRARGDSFCQYAILEEDIYEVEDALSHNIFKNSPLVKNDPKIRFYAGMPITTSDGYNIGNLCVIDKKPRKLNEDQISALRTISKQVMSQLELRKLNKGLKKELEELVELRLQESQSRLSKMETEANNLQKSIDKANATAKFDLKGTILNVNQKFCKILGYEKSELIGQNHIMLFPEENRQRAYEELWSNLSQGKYQTGRFKRIRKDGKPVFVQASYNPVFNENGELEKVISITTDVTNEVRYQKELEEAKLLAEKALVAKDNFLSNMSHEIRTPLNAVIGFSELLKNDDLNEDQLDHVTTILTAGENLLNIINDILDLSKIESGNFSMETVPFSPSHVIKGVKKMLQKKADEKNINFEIDLDKEIPEYLLGDEYRLTQILINLANNALKFTYEGFVKLSAKASKRKEETVELEIRVSDSGIGIPSDKQKMIFERFTQADTDTTRKFGGTGLGLNIVKLLVENFKGDIELDSEPGRGSVFIVKIPFKIAEKQKVKKTKINGELSVSAKILLFEDNLLNQKLGKKILSDLGHDVSIVSTGREGVNWLKQNHTDIILMDLQMPEMDGYQATSYIRKKMNLKTPIIAMTAHSLGQEKAKCLEYGMNDYLSKPFKPEDLKNKILHALKGRKPKEELLSRKVNQDENTLYDLKELELLASGDKGFMQEMIEIFINETPEELQKIEEAIINQDFQAIFTTAHKIKSSFNLIGYVNITVLSSLEQLAKVGEDIKKVSEAFQTLNSDSKLIIKQLKNQELKKI